MFLICDGATNCFSSLTTFTIHFWYYVNLYYELVVRLKLLCWVKFDHVVKLSHIYWSFICFEISVYARLNVYFHHVGPLKFLLSTNSPWYSDIFRQKKTLHHVIICALRHTLVQRLYTVFFVLEQCEFQPDLTENRMSSWFSWRLPHLNIDALAGLAWLESCPLSSPAYFFFGS